MAEIKKEQEYREELFKLMQETPGLPIVPMVDSEIVCNDGYNRWPPVGKGDYRKY